MNKKDLKRFEKILQERKSQLMQAADNTREEGLGVDQDELHDEVDQASTESGQQLRLRLRDRESVLLRKIEKALQKITAGEYGVCEICEEEIGIKRLEARPVTELCIRCKEEQEQQERGYAT
ncbi:MAG: RNA polymerase-binding protein DksA [Deltaproteobacteria bacterium]|nr:RNA polymerase-binding protein DksA [Deltaproteobacteria bacterium]